MEKIIFENIFLKDKICITDQNIFNLYSCQFEKNNTFIIEPCETSKSMLTVETICKFLLEKNIQRSDTIYAVGGGVVGDIVGFVASIFKRGINFVNVPTSLLAMVDSSIGSKNGVNFCGVKNILGGFYAPKQVFIDTNYLKTLPINEYENGMAEVFKYSLIENFDINGDISSVIARCVNLKQQIVNSDYFDLNNRYVLNIGHTLGHALEMTYNLPHGQAVINGIFYEIKISYLKGVCSKSFLDEVQNKCRQLAKIIDFKTNDAFLKLLLNDKKNKDKKVCIMLVAYVGKVEETYFDIDELKELL